VLFSPGVDFEKGGLGVNLCPGDKHLLAGPVILPQHHIPQCGEPSRDQNSGSYWTAARRGLEATSRKHRVTIATLTQWRDGFFAGGEAERTRCDTFTPFLKIGSR
jgi:hypothetical protein